MPYELIWEDHGVVFRFWDVITDDELVQSNLDVYSDPRFEKIEYELAIFQDSVTFAASAETVRHVAQLDAKASKKNSGIIVAIVASQMVIRGLANLYRLQHEVSSGQWTTKYFDSEEEARQWLAQSAV